MGKHAGKVVLFIAGKAHTYPTTLIILYLGVPLRGPGNVHVESLARLSGPLQ